MRGNNLNRDEFVVEQLPLGEEVHDVIDEADHEETSSDLGVSPEEEIDKNYGRLLNVLSSELIEKIMSCSPSFFEKLVVDLLVKMGYGGSIKEAGRVIGQSGDGGIDGVIKEDRLGLDSIFVQAKRWEGNVGRVEIQSFVGALVGRSSRKGVFITTSNFTQQALQYVENIDVKVVLVNGKQLADLMIEYNLGVSSQRVYEIKQVDLDYFES
jgi:restriction system protein